MKQLDYIKTTTFEVRDGFMIDIVDMATKYGEMYVAYLYCDEYSYKREMYTRRKSSITLDDFVQELEGCVDRFIEWYLDVMDYIENMPDEDDDYDEDDDVDCDGDCEHCEHANDSEYIQFPDLEGGSEEELEAAARARLRFVEFMHDEFKTKYQHSVVAFVKWFLQKHTDARYWIAYEDDLTDMFGIVDAIQQWRAGV